MEFKDILTWAVPPVIAAVTWTGSKLINHDTRITVVEEKQKATDEHIAAELKEIKDTLNGLTMHLLRSKHG